ncbi:MAG: hypothetical protein ABR570_13465 [Burkholderiales bacterium]
MRTLVAWVIAATVSGCGVETASTAATAASIKKQELEQGQRTMQQMQQKINGTMQQVQERAASSSDN